MISPREIDTLFAAVQAGEPEKALTRLDSEPDRPLAARVLHGIAALEGGEPARADAELSAVLAHQPDNPAARLNLALARFHLGNPAECARLLRAGPLLPQPAFLVRFLRLFWPLQFQDASIRLAGEKPMADQWPHRAEVEAFLANPDGLTSGARKRLSASLIKSARAADKRHERVLAEHLFAHASAADPQSADIRFTLAHLHLELGRFTEALEIMDVLNREGLAGRIPLPPQAITMHAWALHANGEHKAALLLLSRARPQGPDDFLAHIIAAVCWDALGERLNAERNYAQAFGPFFIESWLGFTKPYLEKVVAWMETSSANA